LLLQLFLNIKENQFFFEIVGTDLSNSFIKPCDEVLAVQQANGGGIGERGIISYVGRLSYNYKQRYFLQASEEMVFLN
jgi:hypothetical protein